MEASQGLARRAVSFTPMETRTDVIVRTAERAEELGYEAIFVPEGWGLDSSVVLTQIALRTKRIKLGSGIQSIWGRSPATLAMTAATLDQLSGGRFICGLGASTPGLAEGFHDVPFSQPARRLRQSVEAVRSLLAGDRARLARETTQRPLRLGTAPAPTVPIYIAALGPSAMAVAAETGDGWIPAFATAQWLSTVRSAMAARRTQAGSRSEPLTVVAGPAFTTIGDPQPAEAAAAFYVTAMGPVYADFLTRQGFGDAVRALRSANPRPDPSVAVIPDDARAMIDQLIVAGPPESVRAQLAQWQEAVDILGIGVSPNVPWELIERQLATCAPKEPREKQTSPAAHSSDWTQADAHRTETR